MNFLRRRPLAAPPRRCASRSFGPEFRSRRGMVCVVAVVVLCAIFVGKQGVGRTEPWSSGGPDMAWITCLLYPYGPSSVILAGTYGGGVFATFDGGDNWTDITGNLGGLFINDLESDGRGLPFVYAATGEGGLWRSRGVSESWGSVNGGLLSPGSGPSISGVAVDPVDPRFVSVSTSGGGFTSHAFGAVWPDSLHWLAGFVMSDIEISTPSRVMYAMGPVELLRTTNRGHSYRSITAGLPGVFSADMAIWPETDDTVLVASWSRGLYITRNADTFDYIGPTASPFASPLLRSVEIDPLTGAIYLASEIGIFYTENVGQSWRLLEDGVESNFPEVWDMLIADGAERRLHLGTFSRGFVTTGPDGGAWEVRNRGLRASWITDLDAEGDVVLAATRMGRLFRSDDGGASWTDVTGNLDTRAIRAVSIQPGGARWFAGTNEGVVFSDDGGRQWNRPTSGILELVTCYALAHPAWTDPGVVYAATGRGLFRSEDAGVHWNWLESVPREALIAVLETVPGDQTIWCGAWGRDVYRGQDGDAFEAMSMTPDGWDTYRAFAFPTGTSEVVIVSTDGAVSRYQDGQELSLGIGFPYGQAMDFASFPERGELYVASDASGVHRSSDGGKTWQPLLDGLRVLSVTRLLGVSAGGPRLYAGTLGRGVYQRDLDVETPVLLPSPSLEFENGVVRLRVRIPVEEDDAGRWLRLARAVSSGSYVEIARRPVAAGLEFVDALDGVELRAGTQLSYLLELGVGDGDTARVLASAGAQVRVPDGEALPRVTRLDPNVPNPFNPRTTIHLELASAGRLRLEIFDQRGRRVSLLRDALTLAGPHAFVWEGRDERGQEMASGVYLLRMQADGREWSRRITLLR